MGSSPTDLQRHPFLPPAPSMAPVPTSRCYSDFWVKDFSWWDKGLCQEALPIIEVPASLLPIQSRWELLL